MSDNARAPIDVQLAEVIARRKSIRSYRSGPIVEAAIERILTAATCAPSAHNRQPWRFMVVDDDASKENLANAMGRRLRNDRLADGDEPTAIERDVERSYARITGAAVVIAVCMDVRDMDHYADERRRHAEYVMAVQSTAMAAQNLLLAAHAEGLGACIMCAPLFCPEVVAEVLDLPDGWQPQMLITIGLPADSGRVRPRLGLDQVVRWRRARRSTEQDGSAKQVQRR